MSLSPKPASTTITVRPRAVTGSRPVDDNITLDQRNTPELVFAVVGAIGSGASTVAEILKEKMEQDFGYDVEIIKSSDVIKSGAKKIGIDIDESSDLSRIKSLQYAGNELRSKFGNSYIASNIVEQLSLGRGAVDPATNDSGVPEFKNAKPRRHVTIVDSLKRPEEIRKFQQVYGDLFYSFCVYAPEQVRTERLASSRRYLLAELFHYDENSDNPNGQKVRDTSHICDFFIRNDESNKESIEKVIDRYLNIVFATEIVTPTLDESAMYGAVVAARASACLSRQVGAVIYNSDGELIGQGCNDVPKSGGGLYTYEDGKSDHRCYKWKDQICHNDYQKNDRLDEIVNILVGRGIVNSDRSSDVKNAIKSSRLKDLIEFSRAVHAEMEAIISVGRNANAGLVGSTLYCTTFPCHNCARHIVASGIRRVVYIEPYAKSLATTLHSDSLVSQEGKAGETVYQQYQGVAPRHVDRFFSVRGERKRDGKLLKISKKTASPVGMSPLDGLAIRELLVLRENATKEAMALGSAGNER